MPDGFFHQSTLLETKAPTSLVPKCGACGLYKKCKSPKMPVTGKGHKGILIVGEAPGETEDDQNRQLCGKSGAYLQETLESVGIDMRKDCWLTNAIICCPPNNETPDDDKIEYCRPNLIKTIKELQPQVIIPLGSVAVKSLIASVWKDDVGSISRWTGWKIPCIEYNAWICPTWHPSYLIRTHDPVLELYFKKHLRAATRIQGCPWGDGAPVFEDQVEVIFDLDKAASVIRKMISRGGVAAFDYETNMLKPEGQGAELLCCSICWEGEKTIAYPWRGAAKEATREFLTSPNIQKIASNLKFEERWTRHEFGVGVRRWLWDTMLAAHVIDNRPDITSIKFQSFIHLGAPSYDDHIKPFLKSKTGMNRASQEIDFKKLMTYCALDSLFEYLVAQKQMELIGIS